MSRAPTIFREQTTYAPPAFPCFVCPKEGCFGLGWPLTANQRWFCPDHKPSDYWSAKPA
jgi:hypothetical protein